MATKLVNISLVGAFITTLFLIGCGDGYHTVKPQWGGGSGSNTTGANPSVNEGAGGGQTALECINLVDYEDFINEASEDDEGTDLTEGGSTLEPAKAMGKYLASEKSEEEKCIEEAIESLEESGMEFYWGNRTWILTRERLSKKPKAENVTIGNYINCEQVKAAACLLIN